MNKTCHMEYFVSSTWHNKRVAICGKDFVVEQCDNCPWHGSFYMTKLSLILECTSDQDCASWNPSMSFNLTPHMFMHFCQI